MKKILMTLYDGPAVMNFLRSSALPALLADPDVDLHVLVQARKLDYYRKQFEGPRVHLIANVPETQSFLEKAFSLACLNSIPTRSLRIFQRARYLAKGNYHYYVLAAALRLLGRLRAWRRLLRVVDRHLIPTPSFYRDLMNRIRPDLLVATNMYSRDDTSLLRLAAERGVQTVGITKSWDHPTTKCFIRTVPDRVLVQTEQLKNELIKLADVPRERITVVGVPQYDRWARWQDLAIPRAEFFYSLGLDPNKALIVYAAAGDWMNPSDRENIELIAAAVGRGDLPPAQILVRVHPKYESGALLLSGSAGIVVERPATHPTGVAGDWEYEDRDVRHLISTLAYASVVLNTASTIAIDAAIIDRPIILIGFDGARLIPYDQSVIRYYDREHLQLIVESGGARLVRSPAACIAAIREYLADPARDASGRARIRDAQCYLIDGQAGRRIASEILSSLRGVERSLDPARDKLRNLGIASLRSQ